MEYIVRHCPNCNGELHVPSDLKSCICMFCGETFLIENPGKEDVASSQEFGKGYQEALNQIGGLIALSEQLMKQFKDNSYKSGFEDYVQNGKTVLWPIQQYAARSGDGQGQIITDVSQAFMDAVYQDIKDKTKGRLGSYSKTGIIDQYRFFLAFYTVPMLQALDYAWSEPVADGIIESWKKQYPKYAFQKASFEKIQKGFQRKGFCFITSAVCESMNRKDDCYELNAFRQFRDTYMLQTADGKLQIEEYYRIAPVVVAHIGICQDSREKYQFIWDKYLQPCLIDIENNYMEECRERYNNMVEDLKTEYGIV